MSPLFDNRFPSEAFKSMVFWLMACSGLWGVLAGGEGWAFGLPVIGLATGLALYLGLRPWNVRLLRLPGFVVFFLRSAMGGALDVAWRALHRRCPIAPSWVRYRFHADDPRVRLLVSAMIGLFPGTLASEIEGDELHVHLLTERDGWRDSIAALERRLSDLLPASGGRA